MFMAGLLKKKNTADMFTWGYSVHCLWLIQERKREEMKEEREGECEAGVAGRYQ